MSKVQEGVVYVSLVLYLNDGDVGWRKDEVGELGGVWREIGHRGEGQPTILSPLGGLADRGDEMRGSSTAWSYHSSKKSHHYLEMETDHMSHD